MAHLTKSVLILAMAAAAVGCESKQNARQQANENWKFARAGVMSSLAKNQYESGNLDEAEKTVGQALKIMPNSMPLLLLSARIRIEHNDLDGAEKVLKQASAVEPTNAEVDYLTAVVYQRYQRFEEALVSYSAACAKNPAELAYPLAKAETLAALDRLPEAVDVLTATQKNFAHSAVLHDALGQTYSQQKNYRAAAVAYRTATTLAPEDWQVKEHLARALFLDKQYEASLPVFDRLLRDSKFTKRYDLVQMAGEAALAAHTYDTARSYFETLTQLQPDSPTGWMSLAKTSLELKDLDRAEVAMRRALALAPGQAEVHLLAGSVRLEQGRLELALVAFRRASTLNPGDPTAASLTAFTLNQLGRNAEARQVLGEVLAAHPQDAFARQLLSSMDGSRLATIHE